MQEVKKILPKLILLAGLLYALNFIYEKWFLDKDFEQYSEAGTMLYAAKDSAEILYFGESSDFTISDSDIDKSSISTFLAAYFPKLKVQNVSKGAIHAGVYYDMLRKIPSNAPLKTVVVTLNLRSFGAAWLHSKLTTPLNKEMRLLQPGPSLWNRLMLSFREYEQISEEATHAARIRQWSEDTLHFDDDFPFVTTSLWDYAVDKKIIPLQNGRSEQSERELACHYIKGFAFQIDPETNPRIQQFDNIVALAKKRGWNLVLHLLPENLERAKDLNGDRLLAIMEANRQLLKNRYGKLENVSFVDNFDIAKNEEFRDQDWTTEHYTESARRRVAASIANALKQFHPKEYEAPQDDNSIPKFEFFNDCEGQIVWSQIKTLDETYSKSGKKSTRFGNENPFGLTFTYPIEKLDSTKLDSVIFECWYYQTAQDTFQSIAFEASGEETPYRWDYKHLYKYCPETLNQWKRATVRFKLWDDFPKADIVKVYPYSKGIQSAWIDDIKITFK